MNAYYQIINDDFGTKLKFYPPTDGGKATVDVQLLMDYLNFHKIPFQAKDLSVATSAIKEETVITLNGQRSLPVPEDFRIDVMDGNMQAVCWFVPPSNDGSRLRKGDILDEIRNKKIIFGVDESVIDAYVEKPRYLENIVVAIGQEPRHGTDARIEYFFNTDLKARPTLNEDGSVDFFNLNIINHCEAGELLARLYPEDRGDAGSDVYGNKISPRSVKHDILRFGKNIRQSDDKLELYAIESGHVSLVEGRVFVSNLMEVENVDTSTGNIDYDGNVQVNGNVCSNFKINATGNVEVRGVVEGAVIEAGGNITIAKGMNGMSKGILRSKGNVIAKFLENATVETNGYVEAGSIMHCNVMAGTEVHVNGKKGFISGGHVAATSLIDVKTLGSEMGTDTVVEVGVSPVVRKRHKELNDQIAADMKIIERAVPILEAARDKYQAGKELSESQIENVRELAEVIKSKRVTLAQAQEELFDLDQLLSEEKPAQVVVQKVVYSGTKIIISDVSKIVKESMQYCRFIRFKGDVKMVGM